MEYFSSILFFFVAILHKTIQVEDHGCQIVPKGLKHGGILCKGKNDCSYICDENYFADEEAEIYRFKIDCLGGSPPKNCDHFRCVYNHPTHKKELMEIEIKPDKKQESYLKNPYKYKMVFKEGDEISFVCTKDDFAPLNKYLKNIDKIDEDTEGKTFCSKQFKLSNDDCQRYCEYKRKNFFVLDGNYAIIKPKDKSNSKYFYLSENEVVTLICPRHFELGNYSKKLTLTCDSTWEENIKIMGCKNECKISRDLKKELGIPFDNPETEHFVEYTKFDFSCSAMKRPKDNSFYDFGVSQRATCIGGKWYKPLGCEIHPIKLALVIISIVLLIFIVCSICVCKMSKGKRIRRRF